MNIGPKCIVHDLAGKGWEGLGRAGVLVVFVSQYCSTLIVLTCTLAHPHTPPYPQIVTTLRQKHKVYVDVCQLSVCCFAVSYRMAIERRTVSELSTPTSASKVAERLKLMGQTYERRVLIVEKDRVKENKKMW